MTKRAKKGSFAIFLRRGGLCEMRCGWIVEWSGFAQILREETPKIAGVGGSRRVATLNGDTFYLVLSYEEPALSR